MQPLADRGRGRRRWREIDTVLTHPQVPGQCARFLRSELRARADPAGELDRRGGAHRRAERRARAGGARNAAGGQDLRRHGHPRGRRGPRRQRNALRVARARARARRAPPLRARAARREWKTSLVFWGAGAERPGGSCAAWTSSRSRRHQPHEDRVATAARAPRQLHVLRRPRRARRATAPVAEAIAGVRELLRGGARARLLPRRRRRDRSRLTAPASSARLRRSAPATLRR